MIAPIWNSEARVTMGIDMPAETCYNVIELLSDSLLRSGKHRVLTSNKIIETVDP